MVRHWMRLAAALAAVAVVTLLAGLTAGAVTRSDVAYFDGFQDLTGVDPTQSSGIGLDALGGLRMATSGAAVASSWTSANDFTTPAPPLGPIEGLSTLDSATVAGSLRLPTAPLAFRRLAGGLPVLSPLAAASVDGFGVGGMSVQRVGGDGNKYYMWYAGVPEDEFAQRIYLATSTNGTTWSKEPRPVLDLGAPGQFDSRQLTKPSVIYDPSNTAAPFRMWYAAEDETSGGVGYAVSMDGRTWTKQGEVLAPGKAGMADSYRVMQPCVLADNGVYFMWYTADDSENRRVAYATSADGMTWKRGGIVFDLAAGGNYSEGAFAPAVVRTASGFHMLFTGNKIVGSGIQSKLINADSSDGLNWTPGNIAFSASGSGSAFDGYNVSQPTILSDPTDAAHPYKMWYVGNNPDANGNYHDRVGLAYQKNPGTVSQWVKVPGAAGEPFYESVLTLGAQGTAFDTMKVADLRPVATPAGGGLYGFYTGTNAADFVSRIGVKQSADDGLTWTAVGAHATLIGAGPAGQFDEGGVAGPSPVVNSDQTGWWVYHTSLDASGVPAIGLHSVSNDLMTVTRSAAAPVLAGGGAYDVAGQADPCVVAGGSGLMLFYAGKDGAGKWSLGLATATTATPASFAAARQILPPAASGYDAGGMRHPVAHQLPNGTWRLLYTAIGDDGVHRIASATAPADLSSWTRGGLVMDASTDSYDFAEGGVDPSAALAAGAGETLYFTGTDRFGWTRVGKSAAAGPGFVASGAATYTLDAGSVRDWRRILWTPATTPAGTASEVWVSYYPTLSGGWSNFYQVARDTDLPFLLTVQKMRWQVRMTSDSAAATPTLEQLTVNHAPVQFPTGATAVTTTIGPVEGKYLLSWGDLVLSTEIPAGAGLTVSVRDDAGAQVVAPTQVTGSGVTIGLNGVATPGSKLVAVLGFTGDGTASAKVKSLTATYQTTSTPSQLTLQATKVLLPAGGSTSLRGKLVSDPTPQDPANGDALPLGGQAVTISRCVAGTTGYTEIGKVTTDPVTGAFILPAPVKLTATTSYRAVWAGATIGAVTYPPAVGTVRVQVKPKITLTLTRYSSRSGKYFAYKLGRTVYAKGAITPNHARLRDRTTAGKVTVTAYRYKSRKWVKVKSAVRTLSASSTYAWSWRPRYKGTYRWAATFAGDLDHAASASPFRYVKVY